MRLIKRLSTTLSASVQGAVDKLENHDAIVEASLKEQRLVLGKTRSRLKSLLKQQTRFEEDKKACQAQIALWTKRAKTLAETDEKKALSCLARRRQLQQKINDLEENLARQKELTSQLQETARQLESKLEEANRQHNLMRARQSVADANTAFGRSGIQHDHLDEVFERWESNVLAYEDQPPIDNFCNAEFDALASELEKSELHEELAAELKELCNKNKRAPDEDNRTSNSREQKNHD